MMSNTRLFVLLFFFVGGFLLSLSLGFCLSVSVLVTLRELRCFYFCCACVEVEGLGLLGLVKRASNKKPQSDFLRVHYCYAKLL